MNDESTAAAPTMAAQSQAWSDESDETDCPELEQEPRGLWPSVAKVSAAALAVAAGAAAVALLWPSPVDTGVPAATTTAKAPPAPAPVTVTASPPPVTVTAPPPTVTVTASPPPPVTVTPSPVSHQAVMTRDERYLANLRAGGVIILDEQVSIQQGRLQCVYFAEHPGATINDAAAAFLLTNWIGLPYREHGAQVVVRSALDAYCPQYAEGSVQ